MQPLILAEQTRQGVADFLTTTFPATTPGFESLVERFVKSPGNLAKGPYLTLGLPFRKAPPGAVPFAWLQGFQPHAHQALAFARLHGAEPRSTLVATGTGSGKTEAFLYPVLEHCRTMRAQGRRGIKAILIYPMNALATDQAGRVAKEIVTRDALSQVTGGLYVGEEPGEKSPTVRHLGDDRYTLITDRDRMGEEPPDILLTNYKMLDFLLMRARDAALWRHNLPDTLRYLVVDELHAYDGAQGTDLACLIRRLKARLRTPPDTLVCVGTSATLGDRANDRLVGFARDVFGEQIDAQAIIGEERESVAEFLKDNPVEYMDWPSGGDVAAMSPQEHASADAFLAAQYRLWFGEAVEAREVPTVAFQAELGRKLKQHVAFQNLLRDADRLGGRAVSCDAMCDVVRRRLRDAGSAPPEYVRLWLGSLLSLIAHASDDPASPSAVSRKPLLTVRVELWLRELRRMVASLSTHPELLHSDDLAATESRVMLPVIHCRDCHAMGWGATQSATDGAMLRGELPTFYAAFFGHDTTTRFVFPADGDEPTHPKRFERKRACTTCGALNHQSSTDCIHCGSRELVLVDVARNLETGQRHGASYTYADHDCPYCDGDRTLTIVGSQAASLASVALGQLFGSRYNADKKLIAFSDSVQDAAHRAGFFEARNWRLNLRPAMAQVIHAAVEQGAPLTLASLPQAFEDRWLPQLGANEYVKAFLPPSLSWLRDYQKMLQEGTPPTDYVRKVTDRGLSWAMLGEFGQEAHVGRTLPRTRTASIAFDPQAIALAVARAHAQLVEKVDQLKEVASEDVHVFLHGVLARLLRIGALWHEQLVSYAAKGCNIFAYRNNPAEFALLKSPRRPHFLTLFPYGKCESVGGDTHDFHRDWARRCFAGRLELLVDDTVFADLYRIALEALEAQGVTRSHPAEREGTIVWGVEPGACRLSATARRWRCHRCRNTQVVDAMLDLTGTPCRRVGCRGSYAEHVGGDDSFYRQLYLHADIKRILSHEHSGLLERDVRERVELGFKNGMLNVLSATPTLEMGIDIGDLSSVLLCSAPPTQANYAQRVGRAGRRTGNAFLPMIAVGRPHDLYFWAQPREMLAGDIEAPGVFLNASAVLERQLTAFTIDRWVRETGDRARVPKRLSEVLTAVKNGTESKFPYTWLSYVKDHQSALLSDFTAMFVGGGTTLMDETRALLEQFLDGNEDGTRMGVRVVDRLTKVNRDLEDLRRRRGRVETEITRIDGLPVKGETEEEELRALKAERSALTRLMATVGSRDTFEFLTDHGLLPNYAFPEQGVLLHSVIVRDDRKKGDEERVMTFEYERPGASAITELAPNSVFYAEGRRVTIDQVDVAHDNKPVDWRFCRNCSYAEGSPFTPQQEACPRCSDTMWSDAGRIQKMMRLTKVYAHSFESRSRIGDDADDRERRFFVRQALVDVDPQAIRQAWVVDDEELPFAFEFASRIRFREVNFGERDSSGLPVQIAGDDTPKSGFRICPECGTLQRTRSRDDSWKNHALYCPRRRQAQLSGDECVFLYREFDSEGIRAYLPESTFAASDRAVHSFIAALQMGLEIRFRGSVDHLRIARDVRIAQDNETPRQYLVIYDSIPGGTGYLKELMRTEAPLFDVLALALQRLTSCECNQDEEKDGCYRCVYSYHNSADRKHVSRRTAVQLLTQILEHRSGLQTIATIGDVGPKNALFDSVLERRFIEALRRRPTDGTPRLDVREEIVRGKAGYALRAGERLWTIEPQVPLGPDDGVVVRCQPDFVLWPQSAPGCLPVAVFMDGWQYHKDSVGVDISKRMAVARSGKFMVWTLTSDDIAHVLEPGARRPETLWAGAFAGNAASAEQLYTMLGIERWRSFHQATAFEQLRTRLIGMTDTESERIAIALSLRVGAGPLDVTAFAVLRKSPAHEAILQSGVFDWPQGADIGRCWSSPSEGIQLGVQARRADLATLPKDPTNRTIHPCVVARWSVPAGPPDRDAKQLWEQWWHALNLLLPMSSTWAAADIGTDLGAFVRAPAFVRPSMPADWEEASRLALSAVQPVLAHLLQLGVSAPVVGFELLGPDQRVVAECELAWPDRRLAVTLGPPSHEWTDADWTALSHEEPDLEVSSEGVEMNDRRWHLLG